MKLVTFIAGESAPRPGLVVDGGISDGGIVDLSKEGFPDALAFIAAPASVQADVAASKPTIALDAVTLQAPILAPPRIFAIGLNYLDHAKESNMKVQDVPTVFMKLSSSVVGQGVDVVLPRKSSQVDFEAEFAVVIGKPGYQIPASDWEEHVFGYTIVNDVSARDIQFSTTQWTLAKSFPTFSPMGPWIVSKDEIPDPHALAISLTLSGEVVQNSNTSFLIFKIPALIEYLSSITPLQAGDVISTGTPSGVGIGRTPQRWLKPGDEMVIDIQHIGQLTNACIAE